MILSVLLELKTRKGSCNARLEFDHYPHFHRLLHCLHYSQNRHYRQGLEPYCYQLNRCPISEESNRRNHLHHLLRFQIHLTRHYYHLT